MTDFPRGIFAPLVTPFAADGIDERATADHTRASVAAGVHGLVVGGSGGEFIGMTLAERMRFAEVVAEEAGGQLPMISCVAAYATDETLALAKHAERLGADAVLATAPYVMRPPRTAVHRHLHALREATALPTMLYNTPAATGVEFSLPEIEELVDAGVLQAVKMSFPEAYRLRDLKASLGDRAAVYCGHDGSALESLLVGADGWISCIPVCFPRRAVELWESVLAEAPLGELLAAWHELLPFVRMLYEPDAKVHGDPHWLEITKLALELLGQPVGPPRAPLGRLAEPWAGQLREILTAMGELPSRTPAAAGQPT